MITAISSLVVLALQVASARAALDASGSATYTATAPGAIPLLATATGASGNVGVAAGALAVRDPADTGAPSVAIAAPTENAEVTFLADVIGSASDDNLFRWTLDAQRIDGAPSASTPWTEIARGHQAVDPAAQLGTLDPTLMLNGLARLRLRAEDVNGLASETIRTVRIDGGAKVGVFRIAFVDLTIPMSGIPITVVRSYDSRIKTKEDFGIGWQLAVSAGEVTQKALLKTGWVIATLSAPFSLPCQVVLDQRDHLTEVRLSERERYVFRPTLLNTAALSGGCRADVAFELVDGTTPNAELYVIGPTGVRAPGAVVDEPTDPVSEGTLTDELTGLAFEPQHFQLRTEDGRTVDIQQGVGVRRIEDRNGNELFVSSSGIVHSDGTSISFLRDTAGRIIRITDPAGRILNYAYNAAGDLTSFTNAASEQTQFTYAAGHQLTEILDPLGVRAAQPEYDADGRMVAVVDADGRRISLIHDVQARFERREDRLGFQETFEYDARGNVTRHIDRTGRVTQWGYDGEDNQILEIAPGGAIRRWTYDASHRPLTETSALGDVRTWTYNARGDVTSETDFDGRTTTTTYDANGNPATETAPDGSVTTFAHDLKGNLRGLTNPLGHVVDAAYDIKSQLLRTVDPSGHATGYVYDDSGNVTVTRETRTLPGGASEVLLTQLAYDRAGRLTQTTDPLGGKTRTEYDAAGPVVAQIDARGGRSETTYDRLGRVVAETAPDGAATATEYDAEDRVIATVDALGRRTTMEYDGEGRPTRTVYPDGNFSASFYDAAGRLERVRDRRGYETAFEYDAAGRQTLVRDALSGETTTAYDEAGRRTSVSDALDRTTSFIYDTAGRLQETIHPDATRSQTITDVLGRVMAEIDPAGRRTDFAYDAVGRLTAVTDAAGGTTSFEYDEVGNRTALVDALGRRREWAFDALGREVLERKPMGEIAANAYDAAGNLTGRVDFNGRTTGRTFDLAGRLTSQTNADGTTLYAYTAIGALARVTGPRGITQYAYDAMDRLVEQANPGGSFLRYAYDEEGNRTALTTPSGTTQYAYDALGRLESITDVQSGVTTFVHDAVGNLATRTQPNQVTTAYTRDARDRLTTIESRTVSNTLLARYAYTLDLSGNRTSVLEHTGRRISWQYDALSRLVEETVEEPAEPPSSEAFGYDAASNRTLRATSAGLEAWDYDANDRLTADAGAAYTYDANGNVTAKTDAAGTTTYTWDAEDRLVAVAAPGQPLVEHVYDHAGDRIETRVGGAVTRYLVDSNRALSQVIEERNAAGGLVASYVHGDDGAPLSRLDGASSAAAYYLHDAQGSVRQLANAAGAITDAYDYTAFGVLRGAVGATANPYRYGGQWLDGTSGLYQLRARWMDPRLGRFLSTDPFDGFAASPISLHRYGYASQGPVTFGDPSGRFSTLLEVSISLSIQNTLATTALPWRGDLAPIVRDVRPSTQAGNNISSPRTYTFPIPKDPDAGAVRGGFFIQSKYVGGLGYGDNRGWDAFASPDKFRIALEFDFAAGVGKLQTNPSCVAGAGCYPPLAFNESGSPNTFTVRPLGPKGFSFGLRAFNAARGGQLLGAIDAFLFIHPRGKDRVLGSTALEEFPSVEFYQFQGAQVRTLLQAPEAPLPLGFGVFNLLGSSPTRFPEFIQ